MRHRLFFSPEAMRLENSVTTFVRRRKRWHWNQRELVWRCRKWKITVCDAASQTPPFFIRKMLGAELQWRCSCDVVVHREHSQKIQLAQWTCEFQALADFFLIDLRAGRSTLRRLKKIRQDFAVLCAVRRPPRSLVRQFPHFFQGSRRQERHQKGQSIFTLF